MRVLIRSEGDDFQSISVIESSGSIVKRNEEAGNKGRRLHLYGKAFSDPVLERQYMETNWKANWNVLKTHGCRQESYSGSSACVLVCFSTPFSPSLRARDGCVVVLHIEREEAKMRRITGDRSSLYGPLQKTPCTEKGQRSRTFSSIFKFN